jgi:hypothetical protein
VTVRLKLLLVEFFHVLFTALKLPFTFPLVIAVGVKVTLQLATVVELGGVGETVQEAPGVKLPVPLNAKVTSPCGAPFDDPVVSVTVAVHVVGEFTATELGVHETAVVVVSPGASVNVFSATACEPVAVR